MRIGSPAWTRAGAGRGTTGGKTAGTKRGALWAQQSRNHAKWPQNAYPFFRSFCFPPGEVKTFVHIKYNVYFTTYTTTLYQGGGRLRIYFIYFTFIYLLTYLHEGIVVEPPPTLEVPQQRRQATLFEVLGKPAPEKSGMPVTGQ